MQSPFYDTNEYYTLLLYGEIFNSNYFTSIAQLQSMNEQQRTVNIIKLLLRNKYMEFLDNISEHDNVLPTIRYQIDRIKLREYIIQDNSIKIGYCIDEGDKCEMMILTNELTDYLDFSYEDVHSIVMSSLNKKVGRPYNFIHFVQTSTRLPYLDVQRMDNEILQQLVIETYALKVVKEDDKMMNELYNQAYDRLLPFIQGTGYQKILEGNASRSWSSVLSRDDVEVMNKYKLNGKREDLLIELNDILSYYNTNVKKVSLDGASVYFAFQLVNRLRYLYEKYYYRPCAYQFFKLICKCIRKAMFEPYTDAQIRAFVKLLKVRLTPFYLTADIIMMVNDMTYDQPFYIAPELNTFLIINTQLLEGWQPIDISGQYEKLLDRYLKGYQNSESITDLVNSFKILLFYHAHGLTYFTDNPIPDKVMSSEIGFMISRIKVAPKDVMLQDQQRQMVINLYKDKVRYTRDFSEIIDDMMQKVVLYSGYSPLQYM